jgi:hypothetical protein
MKTKLRLVPQQPIEDLIYLIQGQRVVLDEDLARVYGVPTKQLNQAIRRNLDRFPDDFAFQLDPQEVEGLRSQIVTASPASGAPMRSQIVTASKRNIRFRPWAFTEHGAIMAANVLNSPRAVQMSVFVVRAFVKMREALAQNKELAAKLAELERKLTSRLDGHEQAIIAILDEIKKLTQPASEPEPKRREIGFHVREEAGSKLAINKRKR